VVEECVDEECEVDEPVFELIVCELGSWVVHDEELEVVVVSCGVLIKLQTVAFLDEYEEVEVVTGTCEVLFS